MVPSNLVVANVLNLILVTPLCQFRNSADGTPPLGEVASLGEGKLFDTAVETPRPPLTPGRTH